MSYYLKNLLNESEKKQILNLHENRKRNEWGGLVMEQNPLGNGQQVIVPNDPDLSPEMNNFNSAATKAEEWFNNRKTKMKNFPEGSVVSYSSKDGRTEFVWETKDGSKLYMDGTAENAQGVKSTNRWYGQLSPDELAKIPTLKPTEIQTNTNPDTLVSTPSVSGSGPKGMMTGREIKQGRGALKRELNAAKKQLKKENKKNIQNCLTYFKNWEKDWNQKDESLQVIVKETSPNYKAYATFLSSCCDILNTNGKQPTLVGLCSTKGVTPETVLGSGPTNPTVNNPVSGAPAAGTEVTGAIPPSNSIGNTPVGTGMPTQGTTTQARPTRSREDQEMIDQGLGQ